MFTNPTAQKVAAQSGGHNQLNRPLRIVVNRDKDVARIVCKLISPKSIKSLCKSVKVKRKRERCKSNFSLFRRYERFFFLFFFFLRFFTGKKRFDTFVFNTFPFPIAVLKDIVITGGNVIVVSRLCNCSSLLNKKGEKKNLHVSNIYEKCI